MDCDAFFASVEQAENPELRGLPVVVGGEKGDRGVVCTCSYEARRLGVKTGMSLRQAERLCPQAYFTRPHFELYLDYSRKLRDILLHFTPQVEVMSIDEMCMDFGGTEVVYKDAVVSFCRDMQLYIQKNLGIGVSFGISTNRFCAKMACGLEKPLGLTEVPYGDEALFFSDFPIKDMHGLGRRTLPTFESLGISTIGELAEFDPMVLEQLFGVRGLELWQHANGRGSSVIIPFSERKSIGHMITYYDSAISFDILESRILFLLEKVLYRLRVLGKSAKRLDIVIRYDDFSSSKKGISLPSHSSDFKVFQFFALSLFRDCYLREPVRLLGVSVSHFNEGQQVDLFQEGTDERLIDALQSIRSEFGFHSIVSGSSLLGKTSKKQGFTDLDGTGL